MNLDKDRLEKQLKTFLTKELDSAISRQSITVSEYVIKESIVLDFANACMKAIEERERLEKFSRRVDLLTEFYGIDKALGKIKELEMLKGDSDGKEN